MPKPPKPNVGRAVVGFLIGTVAGLILVGLLRSLQGIDFYLFPLDIGDTNVLKDWFWEDEATFMFALLFGAVGFVWGVGAFYDFSAEEPVQEKALRIPADPDAPLVRSGPLAPLFGAIPSLALVTAVLIVTLVGIILISVSGTGVEQTTNEAANPDAFGTIDLNLLGIVTKTNIDQGLVFIVMSLIVIATVIGTGALFALLFHAINKGVKIAETVEVTPIESEKFLPIRLAAFFTNWALDMLDGVSSIVRPR